MADYLTLLNTQECHVCGMGDLKNSMFRRRIREKEGAITPLRAYRLDSEQATLPIRGHDRNQRDSYQSWIASGWILSRSHASRAMRICCFVSAVACSSSVVQLQCQVERQRGTRGNVVAIGSVGSRGRFGMDSSLTGRRGHALSFVWSWRLLPDLSVAVGALLLQ